MNQAAMTQAIKDETLGASNNLLWQDNPASHIDILCGCSSSG